jgi:hypothetical protein
MGAPISLLHQPSSKKGWFKAYKALFIARGIEVPPPSNASIEQHAGWGKFRKWKRFHKSASTIRDSRTTAGNQAGTELVNQHTEKWETMETSSPHKAHDCFAEPLKWVNEQLSADSQPIRVALRTSEPN